MADPKISALLSYGKSTSFDPKKVDWGTPANAAGSWNIGQGIIDLLSVGGYGSAGIAKKIGENVSAIQRGDAGGALDLLNPLSVIPAAGKGIAERQTYAPLLENIGVDKNVAPWAGLALDIGLDPLTYLSGGAIAGLKGIPAGVRLGTLATKTGGQVLRTGVRAGADIEKLGPLERVIQPAATELTQSEKLGNYLNGVLRGYEFNKSQHAVVQADRKLAKAAAKEAKRTGDFELADTILKPVVRNVEDAADPRIAEQGLLARRQQLLGIIEGSPKLRLKAEKLATKAEKAADTAFYAPSAKQAAKAPKTSDVGEAIKNEFVAKTPALVDTEASKLIPTPDVALADLQKQEALAATRLKGLNTRIDKLNSVARQIENPLKQGGQENYLTGLRPLVAFSNDPKDATNLLPGVREVAGKYRPAVASKLVPNGTPNFVPSSKTYDTEAEAQAAATAYIERQLKKSGYSATGKGITELSDQVEERITELESYFDTETLRELGVDPAKLSFAEVYDAFRAENPTPAQEALARALNYATVDFPAAGYENLAKAIGFIKSNYGKGTSPEELQLWADKVNEFLTTGEIPGLPLKAGEVEPSDFWVFGDLVYQDAAGKIGPKRVAISDTEVDVAKAEKRLSKAIEAEDAKVRKGENFYERLGNQAKAFKEAEATFFDISTGAIQGDPAAALAVMKKIAPLYEYEVKALPNGKTVVAKTRIVEVTDAQAALARVEGKFDPASSRALGLGSAKSLMQGARPTTTTIGQIIRMSDVPAEEAAGVAAEAKKFFTDAKKQLVAEYKATEKPLGTWEEMFSSKEGVDFLINRVIPQGADAKIFDQAKQFLLDMLDYRTSQAIDEVPTPNEIREIFQEFLSGRNPLAAVREGKIDRGLFTNPESTKFKDINDLVESLTGAMGKPKVELSVDAVAKLANTLGKINADPTATKTELLLKTTASLLSARTETQAAVSGLRRMLETGGVNATVENASAAVGFTEPAAVAGKAEAVVNTTQELNNIVEDAVQTMATGRAVDTATAPSELLAGATAMREQYALEFANVMDNLAALEISSPITHVLPVALKAFSQDAMRKVTKIANDLGMTAEEYLAKLVTGEADDVIDFTTDAIRLDALNTESRINFFNEAWSTAAKNFTAKSRVGKGDVRVVEESLGLKAIESVFRTMGLPVKVQENYGMRMLRAGVSKGEKLPPEFTPLTSYVTFADIATAMIRGNAEDVLKRARFPKTGQNIVPGQIEYAWLALKQVTTDGKTVIKGSPEWDKVRKALDTVYDPKADDLFKPATHVVGGKKKNGDFVAPNADVNAAGDELIQFMIDNIDSLKGIDVARAANQVAETNAAVINGARSLYAELIRFSIMRSKFSENLADLAKFNAIEGGRNNIPGLASLYNKFLQFSESLGTKAFRDQDLARTMADTITNMLFFTKPSQIGEQASRELKTIMTKIKNDVREHILTTEATGKLASPVQPLNKTQETAVKGARRKAAAEANIETADVTVAAIDKIAPVINRQIDEAEQLAASGVKIPEDKATVSSNLVAGHDDPLVARFENVADTLIKHGSLTLLGEKFMTNFSGVYGMGKEVKTIIAGVEEINISAVQMLGNALKRLGEKYNRDIPELNKAFRFLQQYGKASLEAAERTELAPAFEQWLQTVDTRGINMDMVNDMKAFTDSLFGENGRMNGVIHRPVFVSELDSAFGAQGLADMKDGTGFIMAKGAGPDAVRYSWAKSIVEDDMKFNSLEVMFRYGAALHAASTRVGIADSFSHFFGRTAQQIKNEGLNVNDFFKLDPEQPGKLGELGRLLDPNVLYNQKEMEKLQYLAQYIAFDRTFDGSVKKIVDMSDRITHFLKASHTTWRPGHHVTSIVGEYIMNLIAGVTSTSHYSNGARILNDFRPGQYTDDANIFRAYEETNVAKGMRLKADKFDKVGFLNRSGKRVLLSDEAVYALAERFAVLTKPGSSVEDFISSDVSFGKNLFAPVTKVNEKLTQFSSARDNFFRMAHFIKELEKGGLYDTAEEAALYAARQVHEYHPTVASLSAFEKKYARRAVFFYTWQRLAATKVFSLMVEKPGIVTIPSKIQYAFAEYNGFDPESFGDPWDPNGIYASWNTGSTYGPQFMGPAGAGDAWGFQPAVPQLDILNSLFSGFTVQPGQSSLDVVVKGSQQLLGRNLSPLPKWFVELSTGEKAGGGGPITSFNEYAIDQVGGLNTFSKLTGIGQEPETKKTQAEIDELKLRQLLNWFTGQKLTDYSTDASFKKWKSDQSAQIKALLSQQTQ